MSDVTWTPTTIPLRALTPWERNPKRISKTHAARLLELWERLGQFQTIAIGPAGEVYDGHQRLSVLKAAHGGKYEVQALQSSRALSEKEREELTVAAHVGTVGQFSWEDLSGWDAGDLQAWGFDTETLANWRGDIAALDEMINAEVADLALDYEPDESANKGLKDITFSLTPDQMETVEGALSAIEKENSEYPGNDHKRSNALYFMACWYVETRE